MSEKRSSVESQKAPNRETVLVMCATLPSMKSKMLATIMIDAGQQEPVHAERARRADVDQHADERQRVGMDAERHAGADDRAQREHADGSDEPGKRSFVCYN